MQFRKRSEGVDRSILVQTFVDLDPLMTRDHQVVYGSRGTGKTHAMLYAAEHLKSTGDIPIYVDMRTIGSSGGIYGDPSVPLAERGTRLLLDTLETAHDSLLSEVFDRDTEFDFSVFAPRLDAVADAISQVRITGSVEHEQGTSISQSRSTSHAANLSTGFEGLNVGISESDTTGSSQFASSRTVSSGTLTFTSAAWHLR